VGEIITFTLLRIRKIHLATCHQSKEGE